MKSGLKKLSNGHKIIKSHPRPSRTVGCLEGTHASGDGHGYMPGAVSRTISSRSLWATEPAPMCHSCAEHLMLRAFPSGTACCLETSPGRLECLFPPVQIIPTNVPTLTLDY